MEETIRLNLTKMFGLYLIIGSILQFGLLGYSAYNVGGITSDTVLIIDWIFLFPQMLLGQILVPYFPTGPNSFIAPLLLLITFLILGIYLYTRRQTAD